MYENIKIAALQLDTAQADIMANLKSVASAMQSIPYGTDVVVLPELFSTGYIADPTEAQSLAEGCDGPTIKAVRGLAVKHNCSLVGSFLAKNDAGKLYNRAFFVEPSGESSYYDKRHLFSLSEEAKVVNPGTKHSPIVRFRGWNFALAVCYDIRFPAWIRNVGLKYDALLVPANWPEKRSFAWTHLLQARAIENQAYVVGANRSGSDDYGVYTDQTYIYDYMGNPIGTNSGICIHATLQRAALDKSRDKFAVWRDADSFTVDL